MIPSNRGMRSIWAVVVAIAFLGWGLAAGLPGAIGSNSQDDALHVYRQGVSEFKAGRWEAASIAFEQSAAGSSGYLRLCAINMVGQTQRLRGESAKAEVTFIRLAQDAHEFSSSNAITNSDLKERAALLESLAWYYQLELAEEQQAWPRAVQLCEELSRRCDKGEIDAELVPDQKPALVERLARLYWRTGRHDDAIAAFQEWLHRWPNHSRAVLIRRAVMSLEQENPLHSSAKRNWLYSPLGDAADESEPSSAASLPRLSATTLPESPDPVQDSLDKLLKELPADSTWRHVLLLEKGWRCCETNHWSQGQQIFTEVAGPLPAKATDIDQIIHDYAELSRSLVLLQAGSDEDARAVAGTILTTRSLHEHTTKLASAITLAANRRTDQNEIGRPCGMRKLD